MKRLKNDLPLLAKKLSAVYKFDVRLVGPYAARKSGRKLVDVKPLTSNLCSHKLCKTVQLARAKLEVKLGRPLAKGETVDHKNEDCTDDRYCNLQLLTLIENSSKGSAGGRKQAAEACRTAESRKRRSDKSKGELNSQSKVTDDEARALRKAFARNRCLEDLLSKTSLSLKSLTNLLHGVSYQNAGGPIAARLPKKRGRPPKN